VTPDVLIPRPETELAVERTLEHLPADAPGRALDLAAGSGAIALAIAHDRPRLQVVGTDVSLPAVAVARRNAARLRLPNVEFRDGYWYEPVANEHFTLIVSNPPYIAVDDRRVERGVRRFEPHGALFSGADGLDALRVVVAEAGAHLVNGGWLLVEHGDRQAEAVRQLFTAAGFTDVVTHRDGAGLDRCTEGRWHY
jgi:release factor glutamine methyltransferase